MNVRTVNTGRLPLYVEGEIRHSMCGGFMEEGVYTAVVDHTIIVCVDAVIVDRQARLFYLVKRVAHPMSGLWWIGGRRHKGESPVESMCRNFARETGLDLSAERFAFVTIVESVWQSRKQEPIDRGSHNLTHQFYIELTVDERGCVGQGLDRAEYDMEYGLQAFNLERLSQEAVHPAIIDLYNMIFSN